MEQHEAESAYLEMIRQLGFDAKGLFDGLRPAGERIRALFPKLSRGERVMLAFLLAVYDPSAPRRHLPDYDLFAEIQAVDRRNRALIAEWVLAPYHVATD